MVQFPFLPKAHTAQLKKFKTLEGTQTDDESTSSTNGDVLDTVFYGNVEQGSATSSPANRFSIPSAPEAALGVGPNVPAVAVATCRL